MAPAPTFAHVPIPLDTAIPPPSAPAPGPSSGICTPGGGTTNGSVDAPPCAAFTTPSAAVLAAAPASSAVAPATLAASAAAFAAFPALMITGFFSSAFVRLLILRRDPHAAPSPAAILPG